MDVKHLLPFVEALDRADVHAVGVLAVEARRANDVSHGPFLHAMRPNSAENVTTIGQETPYAPLAGPD
jgi:hypothetical protein